MASPPAAPRRSPRATTPHAAALVKPITTRTSMIPAPRSARAVPPNVPTSRRKTRSVRSIKWPMSRTGWGQPLGSPSKASSAAPSGSDQAARSGVLISCPSPGGREIHATEGGPDGAEIDVGPEELRQPRVAPREQVAMGLPPRGVEWGEPLAVAEPVGQCRGEGEAVEEAMEIGPEHAGPVVAGAILDPGAVALTGQRDPGTGPAPALGHAHVDLITRDG